MPSVIDKEVKVKVKEEIVLDQTPGRKTFTMKEKPTEVITKKIKVNRDALRSQELTHVYEVKYKGKTIFLSELEILGPSKMVAKEGKWVGCSWSGASVYIETTSPIIGKDHRGKPWGCA